MTILTGLFYEENLGLRAPKGGRWLLERGGRTFEPQISGHNIGMAGLTRWSYDGVPLY